MLFSIYTFGRMLLIRLYERRLQPSCSLSTGENLYMVVRTKVITTISNPCSVRDFGFSLYRKEIEPTLSNYFYNFAIMF